MKEPKYLLTYNDGKHCHDYKNSMTMRKARSLIAARVARHYAGTPKIEYLDSTDFVEAFVVYENFWIGHASVAIITKED